MKKNILFCIGGFIILLGVIGITTFYYAQKENTGVNSQAIDNKQEEIIKKQLKKDEEYLHTLALDFQTLHNDFQAHDFLNQNIIDDGPEFIHSFAYLQTSQITYDEIHAKVETYLSEDEIHKRSDDLHLYEDDADLYQHQVENNFRSMKKNYKSNLPLQISALQNIYVFLKDHQDGWAVQEKGIIFDSQVDMDEYRNLLEMLNDVPSEVSHE